MSLTRTQAWLEKLRKHLQPARHILLFTLPHCGACASTQKWLDTHQIHYTQLDADKWATDLRAKGHTSAPVVIVHDRRGNQIEAWSGHRLAKLAGLLEMRIK